MVSMQGVTNSKKSYLLIVVLKNILILSVSVFVGMSNQKWSVISFL